MLFCLDINDAHVIDSSSAWPNPNLMHCTALYTCAFQIFDVLGVYKYALRYDSWGWDTVEKSNLPLGAIGQAKPSLPALVNC